MKIRIIELSNGKKAIEAEYQQEELNSGNPLIECLPSLPSDTKSKIKMLERRPEYRSDMRYLSSTARMQLTSIINSYYQPLPEVVELLEKIDYVIKTGYLNRNPLGREINEFYHELYQSKKYGRIVNHNTINSVGAFLVYGASGAGKTTALLRCIESMYPPVIVHHSYKGELFSAFSIPCLHVITPKDGSIKMLTKSILLAIDELIGSENVRKGRSDTVDDLIIKCRTLLLSYNVGILVIDEIQHISLAKSGGRDRILNTILNLSEIVPTVLCGTPQIFSVFVSQFRHARRSVASGGSIVFDRITDKRKWHLVIKGIWKYQFLKNDVRLTSELEECFYTLSIGLPGLLKALFIAVQQYAIRSGLETFDEKTVIEVFNKSFQSLILPVKAFRSGILREQAKYSDIFVPHEDVQELLYSEKMLRKKVKESNTMVDNPEPETNTTEMNVMMKKNYDGDIRVAIELKSEGESNYDVLKRIGMIANPEKFLLGGKLL